MTPLADVTRSPTSRWTRRVDRTRTSLLAPVRDAADLVIDTSDLNVHQLKERIDHAFDAPTGSRLQVAVESFGFKHGLPLDADIVMDVRFCPTRTGTTCCGR